MQDKEPPIIAYEAPPQQPRPPRPERFEVLDIHVGGVSLLTWVTVAVSVFAALYICNMVVTAVSDFVAST